MEPLKRCPFCGSDNIMDHYVFMECGSCKARGPASNNGNFDDHADFRDREIAIERWNKRFHIKEA